MEMMDRPVAVADAEAVAGCDRGADEGLGAANVSDGGVAPGGGGSIGFGLREIALGGIE